LAGVDYQVRMNLTQPLQSVRNGCWLRGSIMRASRHMPPFIWLDGVCGIHVLSRLTRHAHE
jgi:hypothetical protein